MGNQKRTRSHDRHIEPQAPAQPRKVAKKSSYECRRDLFSKKKSVQCDMEEEDEEGGVEEEEEEEEVEEGQEVQSDFFHF